MTQRKTETVDLARIAIDTVEYMKAGNAQQLVYDSVVAGLALRTNPSGSNSFVLKYRTNGKQRLIVLGPFPIITVEEARSKALRLQNRSKALRLQNPVTPADEMVPVPTLRQVLVDYIDTGRLKPSTAADYERRVMRNLSDWLDLPITKITKDLVETRHKEIGNRNGVRGQGLSEANVSMRVLKALLNYASYKYENERGEPFIRNNPVVRLSEVRAWYRIERRQNYILPTQMGAWLQAVNRMQSQTMKDFLLFLLFTGARRNEAGHLKWNDVDFDNGTFLIRDPKNHQDHTVPMSDFVKALLESRRDTSMLGPYVFAGKNKDGPLSDTARRYESVVKRSGVKFCPHDLRRTFLTIGDSLEIDRATLKRLVNHKTSGDVTAGYIIFNVERLRKPMQMITDEILRQAAVVDVPHPPEPPVWGSSAASVTEIKGVSVDQRTEQSPSARFPLKRIATADELKGTPDLSALMDVIAQACAPFIDLLADAVSARLAIKQPMEAAQLNLNYQNKP